MKIYHFPDRPAAAVPPVVITDDEIVQAQARARKERSEAFFRAVRWSACALRRLGA